MSTIQRTVRWCGLATVGSILIPLVGCIAAENTPSQPNRAELIQKLELAREADRAGALDSSVSPAESADFMLQEHKAERVLAELTHGFQVRPREIREALQVPPKRLNRDQVIAQLKAADQEEQREAAMSLDDVVGLDELRERQDTTEAVLKELELGQDVPWSEVQQALMTPQN